MEEERVILKFEKLYKNITLLEFNEKKEMFRDQYEKVTSSQVKRRWKKFIFSFNMADYKRERIWEYLNGDIEKNYFESFVDAVHKGWFK